MSIIEFLSHNHLIAAGQLEEACFCQERRGGSIEDHLYRLGAVSETDLLKAMESCHGWQTVKLSGREISENILQMLPGSVTWEKKVLPFAEDPDTMSVCVACRNPVDTSLKENLTEQLNGRQVKLYAAVGPILDCAIVSHYRSSSLDVAPSESEPPGSETDQAVSAPADQTPTETVLFISPGGEVDNSLAMALVHENYLVVICQSGEEALGEVENRQPRMVLIRDADSEPYQQLLRHLSRVVPNCDVTFYRSAVDLFSAPANIDDNVVLSTANLYLFAAVMAAKVGKSTVEAVKIGPYVDRLCRRLELSARDRLVTISAAYLLDVSNLYFESDSQLDRETALFKLQAVAGDDLVYPPSVLAVTRHMYVDLSRLSPAEVHSADVRTGNILTIVDYCFKHFAADVRLLAHRHDTIEQNLRVQVGTLFLPDVTEAFLELLRDDIVYSSHKRALCHVLILDELNMVASELTKRVRSGWFECTVSESVGDFLLRSRQLKPDFLVIAARGNSEEVQRLVEHLAAQGIAYHDVRAFVVHESDDTSHVSPLLRLGVYDVIRFVGGCEVLLVKMQRILAEREEESRRRLRELQDLGSRGTLGDMNVIDLLQAMGPSDKTLRISITAHGNQMIMFLNKGKLLYAECEGKTGAEAVIESLTWSSGIWSVNHVDVSDLPEPNIRRSIDSILMEGCYRLDVFKHERAAPKETQENSPIS